MSTKTELFKVGDLITYRAFPDAPYRVTRRYSGHRTPLYDIARHGCRINRVSLTGCTKVVS